jgi:hypothetical protein
MPEFNYIRSEVDRMRGQVLKQRQDIFSSNGQASLLPQPSFCFVECSPRSAPSGSTETS